PPALCRPGRCRPPCPGSARSPAPAARRWMRWTTPPAGSRPSMTRSRPRAPAPRRYSVPTLRLLAILGVVAALAIGAFAWLAVRSADRLLIDQDIRLADGIATALADEIAAAVALGIPPDRLVGLDAYL